MNRLLMLFCLLLCLTPSFAGTHKLLSSYEEILNALSTGSHLQIISKLDECSPKSIDAVQLGGIEFSHFLVYTLDINGKKTAVIGMSNTIQTHTKQLGYADEYIRVHIFENNSVELFQQYLSPKDHSPLAPQNNMATSTYTCQLGAGIKIYEL